MSFSAWYKRWRHGHGFGVHSPYAYHMVREVLRPGHEYGYYAYSDIKRLLPRHISPMSEHEARLLFRILVELHPSAVAICNDDKSQFIESLVKLALPEAHITSANEAEMAVCVGQATIGTANIRHAYFTDSTNPAVSTLWATISAGHLYRNPHRALLVTNPHVTKQTFEIKF